MNRRSTLECVVIGIRSACKNREARFDLTSEPVWKVVGELGPRPLSDRALDLLDLAGGIYRVESQIPFRPTNAAREWKIVAPVRDVEFWVERGGTLLANVLGFLNRSAWTFTFTARDRPTSLAGTTRSLRDVDDVLLFSGGMDSTCGAGLHAGDRTRVQLVSFYSNQASLQTWLADELSYPAPTQWRLRGTRGKEGMNLIRAIMFLSIGAAVAETFGARKIFQYENGFLAMAVPAAGNQVPTRHAHPEFHRKLHALFDAIFPESIRISNPFAGLTKNEEILELARELGHEQAETLLRRTETCWRLAQAHVGGEKKRPGAPCGVCTPCIVRRTARPGEEKKGAWRLWPGYAFDLARRKVRNHPVLGRTFRAYLELIDITFGSRNDHALLGRLAPEAQALIGGPAGPTLAEAALLLRRFAREFCDAFGIPRARRTP